MTLRVIEGSWEEILQHAAELQGHRLRVIVLPEPNTPTVSNLREFLGEYVGCIQGDDEPSAEQAEQLVEELIAEACYFFFLISTCIRMRLGIILAMVSAAQLPERRLLLLEDPKLEGYPAVMLRNLLSLARGVICALFSDELEKMQERDTIKEFSACLRRVQEFKNSYPVADYYETMFLFQQWFHSSYRARQGKVLEALMRHFLSEHLGIDRLAATKWEVSSVKGTRRGSTELTKVRKIIQELYPSSSLKPIRQDIDILGTVSHGKDQQRAIAVQIRSRDDTGGTTAKGSLVDFLKLLCELGSPKFRTLYLIGIWDAGEKNQKKATVNKVIEAIKQYIDNSKHLNRLEESLEKGKALKVKNRLYLQLCYGLDSIQDAVEHWTGKKSSKRIKDLATELERWDDFWLAYAVASIEIHNKKLFGQTNAKKLADLMGKGFGGGVKAILERHGKVEKELVLDILAAWEGKCLPFSKPRDVVFYIHDLLLLYAIHLKHCNASREQSTRSRFAEQ